MSAGEVAFVHLAKRKVEGAVTELRREAVFAVVRQRQLGDALRQVQGQAASIEERAAQALRRGRDASARWILTQGMATLKTRDDLEGEVVEARRRVSEILTAIVQAENEAWGVPTTR
jgi:phage shock protein A